MEIKLNLFFLFALCLFAHHGFPKTGLTKPKIYIYSFPSANYRHFKEFTETFYRHVFEGYEVIPVVTLKNLKDFAYLVTEEVPANEEEFRHLHRYPKEKVLLFSLDNIALRDEGACKTYDVRYHLVYDKIFTWNDDFVDEKKYFKIIPCAYWMDIIRSGENLPTFNARKFGIFVGEAFSNIFNQSNYVARADIVDFFERLETHELDYYGLFWPKLVKIRNYKNYRGITSHTGDRRLNKINIAKQYKFDFCYENVINTNGWISERIFDAFAAGCIPVYLGSSNITDYIPANCFVDRRKFSDNDELYNYLKSIDEQQYLEFQKNIKKFLASEQAQFFNIERCIQEIKKTLGIGEIA